MKQLKYLVYLFVIIQACTNEDGGSADPSMSDQNLQSNIDQINPDGSVGVRSQEDMFEPPFENIDVPFNSYNYNNKRGLTIEFETGSRIEIPTDAFQDQNGKPVTENIEVKYREFHTVTDLVISGIKMKYNEGEIQNADFETGGMFEIRAFAQGGELQLRAGKTINVKLASFKSGEFNHYAMNEQTQNWELIGKSVATQNVDKEEDLKENAEQTQILENQCDVAPTEMKNGMKVFDLNYDLNRFKELDFLSDAMWISVGGKEESSMLEKRLTGYNDLTLKPTDSCDVYELTIWKKTSELTVEDEKKFKVKPVWSGNAFKRAQKDYKEKRMKLLELQRERQMAEGEADLWRSFELKGMGVYNCDRVLDYVKFLTVSLAIAFKDKIKSFFYITNNGNVAIKYYDTHFSKFKINPNSTNSIITVLPDNKLGKVSEEEFEKALRAYEANPAKDKVLELTLIELPMPVKNREDVKQHVASF